MTKFSCQQTVADGAACWVRTFGRLTVLLVACCVPGGLAPAGAQALAESATRQAVVVQLSSKLQFEFASFIAALEQGYFREAGLDVSLKEWFPGVNVAKEVAEGRADFGTLDSSLIVERANGRPVVALAALMQHSAVGLLLRRQAETLSASDLAGKRVGTSKDTESEVLAYLQASGVSSGEFRHLPQIGDARRAVLEDKVDAVGVFIGDDAVRELGGRSDFLLLSPRSAGVDLYGTVLLTSESLLEAQPAMVRAFRSATLKGLDYALDHPQELVNLILARYNTQHKSREQLLFEARQIGELSRPANVALGAMSIARWRHVLEVYSAQGSVKPGADLLGFVYDPDAGRLGPLLPWMLGGAILGLLAVGWGLRRFLAREN